jgi:ABC-type polysaccharide/polyol phosphate transport system ATPase subunit
MSSADACVRFVEVGKAYRRQHLKSFLLRELWPGRTPELDERDRFWALRKVSFSIPQGETVAIVGANGSGKSTMLRLLAGATHPTEGRISMRGRVAPVLGIGVGFEPDMTAAENAFLSAGLLGLAPDEAQARLPEMLAFADLGDFEDVAVRHYSSGMLARLGFGVAMHVSADILLIDEVLAVGDGAFQAKCLERIDELRRSGTTLLIATHELARAREFCARGLWIRTGELMADGPIEHVLAEYEGSLSAG